MPCNCHSDGSIKTNVKRADIIFSGQIISKTTKSYVDAFNIEISHQDTISGMSNFYNALIAIYTIQVDTLFKGQVQKDTLTIITGINSAACGVGFTLGQNYIVYATEKGYGVYRNMIGTKQHLMWTSNCTRTAPYTATEENLIIKELHRVENQYDINKVKKKFYHRTLTIYTGIRPRRSLECKEMLKKRFGVEFKWSHASYDEKKDLKNREKMMRRFGDDWGAILRQEATKCAHTVTE